MSEFDKLIDIVKVLRSENGCPWDREQTHESLKPECIEEAAEVVCGINVLSETGNYENLCEELGDLLLQVVMHAQIAQEEGFFSIDDVIHSVSQKMIRRHPHVFGKIKIESSDEALLNWEEIKKLEKIGKENIEVFLPIAFDESAELIERARERKFGKKL